MTGRISIFPEARPAQAKREIKSVIYISHRIDLLMIIVSSILTIFVSGVVRVAGWQRGWRRVVCGEGRGVRVLWRVVSGESVRET